MSKKKILITGGTGFIGYHLAKKCLAMKWQVTSLSTSQPKKKRILKKVKYLFCDISNKKKLCKVIDNNFTYVVNLAGYVDHSNKSKTYRSHYIGCKNLSGIFLKSNIKKFIQIGTSLEYGKTSSPQFENYKKNVKTFSVYSKSKLLSTNFLLKLFKRYNFPVTVLRLYLVYGPYQDTNRIIPITINNSLLNKKFNCSSGDQSRDFTYIDDVINAIIKTLKSKNTSGEIINIGNGCPVKIKSIIEKITKIISKGHPKYGYLKLRKDEILKLYPNIDKAKKLLKWKTKIGLNSGLIKTIKYYKNEQS